MADAPPPPTSVQNDRGSVCHFEYGGSAQDQFVCSSPNRYGLVRHSHDGACAHYGMVSKIQWKPFWLATQRDPQNDWTATQHRVNYDVFAQAPFMKSSLVLSLYTLYTHQAPHPYTTADENRAVSTRMRTLALFTETHSLPDPADTHPHTLQGPAHTLHYSCPDWCIFVDFLLFFVLFSVVYD